MSDITLIINGIRTTVPADTTILDAARRAGVKIPTLCYHPDQEVKANCRVCVVEVEGQKNLLPSCATLVSEGMVVKTTTARVMEARRTILELILAHHPQDCLHCVRSGICELQELAASYDVRGNRFLQEERNLPLDFSSPAMVRDPNKCLLCGRCVEVCSSVQTVHALGFAHRGFETRVVPSLERDLSESPCVMCGQCIHACPVGAISENEQIDDFFAAAVDLEKTMVVQIAPSVRLAMAEELSNPTGELGMPQLINGLRKLGFDYVLSTNFSADLTIMEEGHELLERLREGRDLPMVTSCCPAWVNFLEVFYPDQLGNLSTCKSPQQMFGALVKTYWADKMGIDPARIFSVSIMPCTAKKYEALRPEMADSSFPDVDLVLTTRELARLFRMTGVDPLKLEGSDFDSWMGEYTGAAVIFGASGGVMEAALRTVYEKVTGHDSLEIDFNEVRGMQGIKEAQVDLDGTVVKVAVAHSLGNARRLMEQVKNGESPYHFIEVMACPGGCVGGGGQPLTHTNQKRAERVAAIYSEEQGLDVRKSHDNSEIKALYEEFLYQPLGEKGHDLLHTKYSQKSKGI
ncbi:MAG: 2Fe-2S iron-sulfur cluster binding domain-containing protein [Firmicutes bacterium]|nr:2Fe-2S iron-sulfur cluster binding domain-containing protein [Bacillota bacterium]